MQDIYDGTNSRYAREVPKTLHEKIQRLFDQLNAATRRDTLRIPPGNQLERERRQLAEFWSLRINKLWRIIFRWEDSNALDVDVIDYH